jgi:hypothetical protein
LCAGTGELPLTSPRASQISEHFQNTRQFQTGSLPLGNPTGGALANACELKRTLFGSRKWQKRSERTKTNAFARFAL